MVNDAIKRYIERMIRPIIRRQLSSLVRAEVVDVVEDISRQALQVIIENDEGGDNIERFQNYGFSSVPPKGSEAILAALKSNLAQRIALAVEKKELRPKGDPLDVFVYHAEGHHLRLTKDGKLFISVTDAILDATNSLTIISPQTLIEGPLHVTGGISTDLGIYAAGIIASDTDISANGLSYLGHTHRDAEGRLTTPPIIV